MDRETDRLLAEVVTAVASLSSLQLFRSSAYTDFCSFIPSGSGLQNTVMGLCESIIPDWQPVTQMPASCIDMEKYAHNPDANLGAFGKSTETHISWLCLSWDNNWTIFLLTLYAENLFQCKLSLLHFLVFSQPNLASRQQFKWDLDHHSCPENP